MRERRPRGGLVGWVMIIGFLGVSGKHLDDLLEGVSIGVDESGRIQVGGINGSGRSCGRPVAPGAAW